MSFIKGRLRRLEERSRGGRCDSCSLPPKGHGRIVLIDNGIAGEGFPDDPEERCSRCGRRLWCVIEVVYDSPSFADTEGGGVIPIG
jgi:hypothetical protein